MWAERWSWTKACSLRRVGKAPSPPGGLEEATLRFEAPEESKRALPEGEGDPVREVEAGAAVEEEDGKVKSARRPKWSE